MWVFLYYLDNCLYIVYGIFVLSIYVLYVLFLYCVCTVLHPPFFGGQAVDYGTIGFEAFKRWGVLFFYFSEHIHIYIATKQFLQVLTFRESGKLLEGNPLNKDHHVTTQ